MGKNLRFLYAVLLIALGGAEFVCLCLARES